MKKNNSTLYLVGLLVVLVLVSGYLFIRLQKAKTSIPTQTQVANEQETIPTEEIQVITPTRGVPPTVAVVEEGKVKVYEAVINMTNTSYDPTSVEIATGGQVKFVNTSDTVKTPVVFAEDGSEIVSLPIKPNLNLTHMFNDPGIYTYGDKNNPEVKGTITVISE
jgi:plastocyanin